MTRIPTLLAFERTLGAMNERRNALMNNQQQLASGKRLNSLSDDPLAAAQAERTRSQIARLDTEGRMTAFSRHMLSQADNALGGVGDALQFARETMVAAGNGALAPADRTLLAQQLRGARDELLALANQRDGAGGYVFGGQGTRSAPFDAQALPVPTYRPTAGEQASGLDAAFATSQDGRAIFSGSGSDASPDIFQTLDAAVALLEDPASTGTALSEGVGTATEGIDSALERVSLQRTRVGEQLRALDSRDRLVESGAIEARGQLSELMDVDYAAAISQFQGNQTSLEAAMSTYAKISRLTLFDYL